MRLCLNRKNSISNFFRRTIRRFTTQFFSYSTILPIESLFSDWSLNHSSDSTILRVYHVKKYYSPIYPTTVGTSPTIWDPRYQAPTYDIKPRPTISGPDLQYQAPKLNSDSGHVQSDFLPVQRAKFMNISINKMELNYFSPNCVLFHSQFVKYLAK